MLSPLFPFALDEAKPLRLAGRDLDVNDYEAFTRFLAEERGAAPALIGGYAEDRGIYRGSQLFAEEKTEDDEPRSVHLGVDVWAEAGTPVASPLDAIVHSFANNNNFGDYGATVILEHRSADGIFFTLFGHLACRTLAGLEPGRSLASGEVFAWLGEREENGGWPPHLHFQRMIDLQGRRGDFPGVARPSEVDRWLRLCPNPADLMI